MQIRTQRVLVTGATGFLGRSVVRQLGEAGCQIVAVGRKCVPLADEVEYHRGDILDGVLDTISSPIDQIIHLAGTVYERVDVGSCLSDNVLLAHSVGASAKKWGTKRIIFASTSGVYEETPSPVLACESFAVNPTEPYALSKFLSEVTLRLSGVDTVILRLTYLYGEAETRGGLPRLLANVEDGSSPAIYDESRDFLHVEDAARAIRQALSYSGAYRLFNIGTGQLISMEQIARAATKIPTLVVQFQGSRPSLALDSRLGRRELHWEPTREILADLPQLIVARTRQPVTVAGSR